MTGAERIDLRAVDPREVERFIRERSRPQQTSIEGEFVRPVPYLVTVRHQNGRTSKVLSVGLPRVGDVLDMGGEMVTVDMMDDEFVVHVAAVVVERGDR